MYSTRLNQYLITLFVLVLFISFYALGYGIDLPIADSYVSRQAQTAMTVYWFVEEGFTINYITPLLGPPWSIPLEFPIFQFIVAFLHKSTDIPLDSAGRVVSILFYYVSLAAVFLIFRNLRFTFSQSLLPIILLLASPLYMFWSRTFMIESTAVAFGLLSVLFFLKSVKQEKSSIYYILAAVIFGTFSALTKITTFCVFAWFTFLLIVFSYFQFPGPFGGLTFRQALLRAPIIIVPIVFALIWNAYADFLKGQNSLAFFVSSQNLTQWTFGTIDLRLSWDTWKSVLERSNIILGAFGFMLIGVIALFDNKTKWLGLAFISTFVVGPLVFTKLYFRHEYYYYATGLFLLLFLSIGLITLIRQKQILASLIILSGILVFMQIQYWSTYPDKINNSRSNSLVRVGEAVAKITEKSDVLLIYGMQWNGIITYYAERKAIMDIKNRALNDPAMKRAFEGLGQSKVGAVIFCGYGKYGKFSSDFLQDRVEYFKMDQGPEKVGNCRFWYQTRKPRPN